ncbi:MAG: hypothetical protein JWM68_3672 [Verrucomicrobiales bacterium]|nr:hypothetical protein [Verrucomicrobiales bacterium]
MVSPTVILGRSDLNLYFKNGILTGSSELSDTTELPKAVIAAVQSAIPLLAKTLFAEPNIKFPAPYLFKIIVSGGSVTFVGKQGDTGIIVPVAH